MYNVKAAGVGAAGSASLAYTGMNTMFFVVAGFTLIMAGLALTRLVPRRER